MASLFCLREKPPGGLLGCVSMTLSQTEQEVRGKLEGRGNGPEGGRLWWKCSGYLSLPASLELSF